MSKWYKYFMKIKSIWLAVIVVVSCLFIQIRYNSSPFSSIFFGLLSNIGHAYIPQFLVPALFLITVSLLEKKWLIVLGVILMILSFGWFYFTIKWLLDFSLLSQIPFFLACIFTIWYVIAKR